MRQLPALVLVSLCAVSASVVPAHAGTPSPAPPSAYTGAIAEQSLANALDAFALETGLHLIYPAKLATGLHSPGAPAGLSPQKMLQSLLRGTGLKAKWLDEHTVSIESDIKNPSSSDASDFVPPKSNPRASTGAAQARIAAAEESPQATEERHSQTGQPPPALSEIIVTAQKYSQRAFDVPISLDVITGQELRRLNTTSLNDLQYDVAGLYVEGGHFNNYIVLRGVSNLAGNGALVGEYIDDADISADGYAGQVGDGTGDVQLHDIERVEVLKGPQGTLYGDGAMGGVICYITNKPAMDQYEFDADVSALFTQYGAPSQRTETVVNAPLIPDALALRIAGQFQHDGGWVDEPSANLKNINELNVTDVRIEGLWRPTTSVKALLTQVIHRETYGIGAGEDAQGNVTPVYGVTVPPHGNQSFNLSNVTVTADFEAAQLISSSTYMTHAQDNYDTSYVVPGEIELVSDFPVSNETVSEEMRLRGTSSGPWQWMLGGFYKHYIDHDGGSYYFGPPGPLSTATYFHIGGNAEQSNARAVFADTNVAILRGLTVGAGVRYFQSDFRAVSQTIFLNDVPAIPANRAEERFTSSDPRFYVQYRMTSHINTYVSAAKGFRSGEPNLGLIAGYDPESLWSYDLGTKMRYLRGYLRSDEDVFYENYTNYVGQGLITVYGVPTFGNFNIGNARVKGLDADLAWVGDRWRITAKGEVVSSKFVKITAAQTGYLPGEPLPFVPGYTVAGSVERDFHLGGKREFALLSYSETGRVRHSSPPSFSDVIHFVNFRAGIRWSPNLDVALFAQNLLDDRGYLDPNSNEASANRARPRTFGVDFRISLE